MAFRVVKERRKARRVEKLDELFEKHDKNKNNRITLDGLRDIFRIYQVEFDEEAAKEIIDENEEITKADFIKFGIDAKLVDFSNPAHNNPALPKVLGGQGKVLGKETSGQPETKERKQSARKSNQSQGLFSCCVKADQEVVADDEVRLDKVEAAFRKFDTDGDGYLSWEEFQTMTKNMGQEQAQRFFQSGDMAGDNRISLQEFRRMADRQQAK